VCEPGFLDAADPLPTIALRFPELPLHELEQPELPGKEMHAAE